MKNAHLTTIFSLICFYFLLLRNIDAMESWPGTSKEDCSLFPELGSQILGAFQGHNFSQCNPIDQEQSLKDLGINQQPQQNLQITNLCEKTLGDEELQQSSLDFAGIHESCIEATKLLGLIAKNQNSNELHQALLEQIDTKLRDVAGNVQILKKIETTRCVILTQKKAAKAKRKRVYKKRPSKPCICDVCSKKCNSYQACRAHKISVHATKEELEELRRKNFCEPCQVGFTQKGALNEHNKKKHLGRRIKCDYCPQTFTATSSLNTHVNIVHKKLKPFKCSECSKRFAKSDTLKRHIENMH